MSGYTISSINGVFTDEEHAKDNQKWLKYFVDRKIGGTYKGEKIEYKYLLNKTHLGGAEDLLMAAYQKYFDDETVQDYDLVEMIKDASEKVATQKLLLVAHSQGNFYANSFYDTVSGKVGGVPAQSIGVYAVATPSGRVAGGGKWLTSDTDKVIAGVVGRVPFRKIMSPNTRIELQSGDNPLGHDFSDIYLKYRGDKIVSDIESSLDKLQTNDSQKTDGPCLAPPELSVAHKVEGAVLAVADPVANVGRDAVVGTAEAGARAVGAVSALGSFVGRTTFAATAAAYYAVKSLANAGGNAAPGGNTSAAPAAGQVAQVSAPVNNAPVKTATADSGQAVSQNQPPLQTAASAETSPTAQTQKPASVSTDSSSAVSVSAEKEKIQSETRYEPKIIFIGLPAPGFGGGSGGGAPLPPPVLASAGELSPVLSSTSPSETARVALAAPAVSVPQCDYSLASDGCLLATTTLRFVWQPVPGADYYEVSRNGAAATTTETTLSVSAPDFSDYILSVSAVSTTGAAATSSAASAKTISVATIPIAINEIAWMGTVASPSDEWMELKNNTAHKINLSQWALAAADDTPYITLAGVLEPGEYRVLERRKNTVIADAAMDDYGNGASKWSLGNSGEEVILSYASTTLDATPKISGGWAAGYNSTTTRKTMERFASKEPGADPANWGTNLDFIKNGADSAGGAIDGTPGARNSVSYLINKGRDVAKDLTLTDADGYFISTSTTVLASSTLAVEPGAVIKFFKENSPDSWTPEPELKVFGELHVEGTPEAPVVFESFAGDQTGRISFAGSAGATSTVAHAFVKNIDGVLLTNGARVEISDTQFTGNYYGLDVEGGSTVLADNVNFASTTREAISAYDGSVVTVASSTITNSLNSDAVGVYGGTNLSIASSTIDGVYRGDGIGIYHSSSVITNSTVANVSGGDGIGAYGSDVSVSSTTIDDVHGDGAFVADSRFSISSSTVKNTGSDGLNLYKTNSAVENVTVENGQGDGIAVNRGTAAIDSSAVSGFADGAGISVSKPAEPVAISNTEISGNAVGISSDIADSVSIAPDVSLHDNGQDVVVSSP